VVKHAHPRLSALVDGELDHENRDRVLAHLAHCAECRAVVDAERQVKAILAGTSDPAPSESFQAALLGLGAAATANVASASTGGTADGALRVGGTTRTYGPLRMRERSPLRTWRRQTGPWTGRPPVQQRTRRPGDSARALATARFRARRFPRRMAAGMVGLAAMAGMAAVAAFAAGGDVGPEVRVVPPVQQYSVEPADTVSELPLSDPGAVTAVLERGLRRSSHR
jgi:anti-sigma factor RsiW